MLCRIDKRAAVHVRELLVPGSQFFGQLDGILIAEAVAKPGIPYRISKMRRRYQDDLEAVIASVAVIRLHLLEHDLHLTCYVHRRIRELPLAVIGTQHDDHIIQRSMAFEASTDV